MIVDTPVLTTPLPKHGHPIYTPINLKLVHSSLLIFEIYSSDRNSINAVEK